jgi:ribonuclease P protein component
MAVLRLRGRRDFSRTFSSGRSYRNRLVVVIVMEAPGEATRVGYASARAVGTAVKRNRIRRRLRAVLAEVHQRVRPGRRVVVLGKAGVLDAPWDDLRRAVVSLLDKASCLDAG